MNSREEFEKWYESDAMPLEADWFIRDADEPEYYAQHQVQSAWEGWQAREDLFPVTASEPPQLTDYQKTLAMMIHKEYLQFLTEERKYVFNESVANCKRILEACKE